MRSTPSSQGRAQFTLEQWRDLLLRSVGFEPVAVHARGSRTSCSRGWSRSSCTTTTPSSSAPAGTGKSHLFQQISPYAHLVSGGKATIANMFVNNTTGRRGLVAQYDVVCFDEVSGVSFDQKEGVNILKGYMESGRVQPRQGVASGPTAASSWSATSTSTWTTSCGKGHLLGPLPKEMRDDTAFMDRHPRLPARLGRPEARPVVLHRRTSGSSATSSPSAGASCGAPSRLEAVRRAGSSGAAELSGRDRKAANNTVNGLLKLLWPDPEMEVPDEFLDWAAELAVEMRRRVKEQQAFIGAAEFGKVDLGYSRRRRPETVVYCEESVRHRLRMESEATARRRRRRTATSLPAPDPDEVKSSTRTPGRPTTRSAT